ncbi:hypothetical protein ABK040_015631 [Willaertia magna]
MNQQYKEVKSDDSLLDDDWVSVESYGEMILKEKNQNNNNTTISSFINNPLLNNSLINNNNTATTINFTNSNIATSSLINNLQSSSIISVPFKVDIEKEYIKKVQEQMEKEQLEEKERKEKYEKFIENLKRKSSDSNSPISTLSSSYNAFYNSEYINMNNNDTSSNNSTVTMNNSNVNNNNFQSIPSSSSFYNNNNFVNNNTSIPYLNKSITELGFKTEDEMECYLHCIEMGFNPIISKFSTEAYCGDKLKVFDCCDKYKQLLDMRFSDTEIQEALLVTDRKIDDAIDYLTQLQNMKINSSTNDRNSLNGSNGMMNNGNMYY